MACAVRKISAIITVHNFIGRLGQPDAQESENMKRKVLRTWGRPVSLVNPVLKERLMALTKRIEEGKRP